MALSFSAHLHAETIGIRFIVSEELANTPKQRLTTQSKLVQYVAELNERYRNSEVNLQAKIVDVEFAQITSVIDTQIIKDMALEQNGFSGMFRKAHEFGADYTIAMPGKLLTNGKPGCGRAYAVNQTIDAISDPRKAFAVVNFVCGAHTIAHELGHLMGLNHGSLVDACYPNKGHTSAIASYANGYAEGNCDGKPQIGEFGDIMVGGHMSTIMGNSKGNLAIFSNPRIHDERCGENKSCGNSLIGDAARALNENARYYAEHN
ncbi:MAG: zinc-dependent metalloprotease family protein [Gallionellaceae bacterium]